MATTSTTSNIVTAQLRIEGVRPLLFHRFSSEAIPLEKRETHGVPGNDPEEWRRTFLATADGQLYLPPTYLFSCIKEGASFTKKGKGNLKKPVASTLQIADFQVLIEERYVPSRPVLVEQGEFTGEIPDVYIDVSGVRNPSTGGRQVRYRLATAPGWCCTINLQWDKTVVSRQEMEAVCRDAGKLVGLGDGRGIGYGRFEVQAFQLAASG